MTSYGSIDRATSACVDGGPIGKKPRIGKMVGASAGVVNGSAPDLPQTASVAGSDCGATIEFSKEAVEALLNEKMEKGYGLKDMEQWQERTNYIRRLRLCIKWFLELEGNYMEEQEKLQTMSQTASVAVSDCGATIEFSKEAVEALLNEKMEKGYGLKDMEQWEQRFNYIRRLQLCIKWFLELEGNYMVEQEKLQTMSQTASVAGSDCGAIEYSKEAVEALLIVKMNKGSSSSLMEQWQERTNYIRRLRLCIKWFLELEGNYMEEQEKLQAMLNAVERRCDESELFMKNEEELIAIIMELRKKVAKEESDKLAVTNCLAREKEARVSAEKLQSSLSEGVTKYQGELQASNRKLSSLNEMYKRLQEYNTSLQQYNTNLQSEVDAANDNLKRVEKENDALVEILNTTRGLGGASS